MYKTHPNFSRANQEKSANIEHGEINILIIINDKTFDLHNSFLNKNNRNIKVTLNSKLIENAR